MLDVRRLRLLVELHRRGTLHAVAQALNFSPSTVSEQLKTLERETGTQLLQQSGRRVQLTEQARTLVAHAEGILDQLATAEAALAHTDGTLTGTLRVAAFQSAAHAVIPAALTRLAHAHPQLRVEVAERAPEDGLFEVAARGFDLAIAEEYPGLRRPRAQDLDHVVFARDRIRLALPYSDQPQPLADLAERAWVMEPEGTASRQWAVQLCRSAGFEPDVRYETGDLMAHIRLIRAGLAVGVLPDLVWAGDMPDLTLCDLPGMPERVVFSSARVAAAARPAVRAMRTALASLPNGH